MFAKSAKSANVSKNSDESADADAMAAEGRRLLEAAKTAPSGVEILPNGEIVADSVPTPGSRQDLLNHGNRLLEQARLMRLAEAEKREQPPEQPDIPADISRATGTETQSPTDTWADKTADIIRDNPQPPATPPNRPARPRGGIAGTDDSRRWGNI